MKPADIPAVAEIAERAHPLFPEEPEVFAEKQRLFSSFCFILEFGGAIAGYCLAHPWTRNRVPTLNRLLESAPDTTDCLFVHDVAIAPSARGKGATGTLMETLVVTAKRHRLGAITLVSLYGSDRLWRRYGFVATDIERDQIASYGPSALYMSKSVD
jgi:GNAT superfamily N-acetyltransferase